jgi:hypothetical protein
LFITGVTPRNPRPSLPAIEISARRIAFMKQLSSQPDWDQIRERVVLPPYSDVDDVGGEWSERVLFVVDGTGSAQNHVTLVAGVHRRLGRRQVPPRR